MKLLSISFSAILTIFGGAGLAFSAPPELALIPDRFDNPVYTGLSIADPFCWYFKGTYYLVSTGITDSVNHNLPVHHIPLIKSVDLQHWQEVGPGLEAPAAYPTGHFWAPEVNYNEKDATFYMYYSAGNGPDFTLRVASSKTPEGPFKDTNTPLTKLSDRCFAIDPDVFRDDDGQRYLFFVTELLDGGTKSLRGVGLVMQHMKSMTEVDGPVQTILQCHWRWQLYETNRRMHGKTSDWYTAEGPEVFKRRGKYYCFYSGGNFANSTYGLSYLVADNIRGPWIEVGGFRGAQLTRTIPGKVLGPGHCCVIASPDGQRDFLVYHAWDKGMTGRQLWVDPIVWTDHGPVIERFASAINDANRISDEAEQAGRQTIKHSQ